MKVLIIGFTKLKYMPYMNMYLNDLDYNRNEVHIIYWNRDLKEESKNKFDERIMFHEFKCYQEDDVPKFLKIKKFIKFRKYVKNILRKEKFDFIVVLHTVPAILIQDYLELKFKNNYILDYRDYTYENNIFYKKMIASLVRNSKYTFVSSDRYRAFLPQKYKRKIITSHNIVEDDYSFNEKEYPKILNNKIRISFWGFIREEKINLEIIKKISMDNRFELHYYGREQKIALSLKEYSKKINATNVFFHGEYKPNDRKKFSQNTDLIHNIYTSKNSMMSMGNKYYDGLIFKIPQLCMQDSFMGEKCTKNKIGIELNPYSENFTDDIYDYWNNINKIEFKNSCNKELQEVIDCVKESKRIYLEMFIENRGIDNDKS